jgi:hypothetical protein
MYHERSREKAWSPILFSRPRRGGGLRWWRRTTNRHIYTVSVKLAVKSPGIIYPQAERRSIDVRYLCALIFSSRWFPKFSWTQLASIPVLDFRLYPSSTSVFKNAPKDLQPNCCLPGTVIKWELILATLAVGFDRPSSLIKRIPAASSWN